MTTSRPRSQSRSRPRSRLLPVDALRAGTIGLRCRRCRALLSVLGVAIVRQGAFLTSTTSGYPVTVLGYQVAQALGVASVTAAGPPPRIRIGGAYFTVAGILNPLPLAPEIDRSALVGFPIAARILGYDGHSSRIYVRTAVTSTQQVANLLGLTANPENPGGVAVSQPSAALTARIAVAASSTTLFLGLGAVVLLVGGIGIANVMVIAVLERRTEIGLRRALGAARRHIAAQFLAEALILGVLGAAVGLAAGTAITAVIAWTRHWTLLIPAQALWGGLAVAVIVATLAGLYPAARAARLSPTEALRTV